MFLEVSLGIFDAVENGEVISRGEKTRMGEGSYDALVIPQNCRIRSSLIFDFEDLDC